MRTRRGVQAALDPSRPLGHCSPCYPCSLHSYAPCSFSDVPGCTPPFRSWAFRSQRRCHSRRSCLLSSPRLARRGTEPMAETGCAAELALPMEMIPGCHPCSLFSAAVSHSLSIRRRLSATHFWLYASCCLSCSLAGA